MEKKYKLVSPSQEELEAFGKKMETVLNEFEFVLRAQPITKLLQTGGFILDAEVVALKKVEVTEPIPSPFVPNGENPDSKETPEANS